MPAEIATVVSRGKATLHELDTVYGLEDVYDMLEVIAVDALNDRILSERAKNG